MTYVRLIVPVLVACAILASSPTVARAQDSALPDVVKLADGSFFRGTILEHVAGDHVELQLASCEHRRFTTKDVAYAGPKLPEAASYGLAVAGPTARVVLAANTPDVTYEVRTGHVAAARGGSIYTTLCTAPCEVNLPLGAHKVALSHPASLAPALHEIDAPVTITGPSRIEASYTSRATERWIGLGLVAVGGTASLAFEFASFGIHQGSIDGGLMGAAIASLVVSMAIGLPLGLLRDKADVRLVPLILPHAPFTPTGGREGRPLVGDAGGAGIAVRF